MAAYFDRIGFRELGIVPLGNFPQENARYGISKASLNLAPMPSTPPAPSATKVRFCRRTAGELAVSEYHWLRRFGLRVRNLSTPWRTPGPDHFFYVAAALALAHEAAEKTGHVGLLSEIFAFEGFILAMMGKPDEARARVNSSLQLALNK